MEAPQPIVFDTSAIDGTQLSLASPLSFGPAPSSDTNSSILSSQVFTFGQAPCDTTHITMRETQHTDEVQIINENKFRIGIDFGGVLSVYKEETDDEPAEHMNTELDMPNAINSLETLKELGNDLYLISFCGKKRAIETFNAIEKKNVSNLFNEQFYVKSWKYKSSICKFIGCHFMVDDRKDVLDNIRRYNDNVVTILFGSRNVSSDENILPHKYAQDWSDVMQIISETAYFEVAPNEDVDIEKMLSLKYYPESSQQINDDDYMTFD